jgi:DNA repair protein RadA
LKSKEEVIELKDIPHVGAETLKKLNAIGVYSLRALYTQCSATSLASLTGKKHDECSEIILFVGDYLEKTGKIMKRTQSAWDLYREQMKEPAISTGSVAFDNILGGGIRAGYVSEIYGENKSGKTQTCISLCINTLVNDESALVLYIDTENKLKIERLINILIARKIVKDSAESEKYLNRLMVWRPANSDEQMMYITNASGLLDSGAPVKLFVVDSIISLFQSEYMDRGVMKSKFSIIKPMMLNLMKLAMTYKIPVLVVNTVFNKPDEMYGADPIIAAGGNSVGHPLTYRIKVREVGSGKKHRALMVKSPEHAESEADFIITDKGIEDV